VHPWIDTAVSHNMRFYKKRLKSLRYLECGISKKQLAKAGFWLINGELRCFHCNLHLENVTDSIDPWIEHVRWQPKCSFLKMTRGILFMWSVRDVIKIEKYMLAF
jgi:baculoviral IAP repeat-containing protein 2/3